MQKIDVHSAEPGMTLAKPVTRPNGTVLMAKGTELTASIISRLHRMDISHIFVHGAPEGGGEQANSLTHQARLQRLDHLFRKHASDPWMLQVKKFFRIYFQHRGGIKPPSEQEDA
jgi:hypothetical protein